MSGNIAQLLGGALGVGGGTGFLGGLARGKDLGETITDVGQGLGAGMLGGGVLGAGLASLIPAASSFASPVSPLAGAMLGAGLGGGILAALKGVSESDKAKYVPRTREEYMQAELAALNKLSSIVSDIEFNQKTASILEEISAKHMDDEIHQQINELTEAATDKIEADNLTKKAYMNFSAGPRLLGMLPQQQQQQHLQQQPQPQPQQRQPSVDDEAQRRRHAEIVSKLEKQQKQQQMRGIASPLGAYAGQQLGEWVSDLGGYRPSSGISGLLGFKEKRIDPEISGRLGKIIGEVGAGELASRMV